MIDVQREMKAELKQGHTELRAEIERNAQLLRTEIKADAEANAQLLRTEIKAGIERIKADAEANAQLLRFEIKADAYKLRLDLEQKINSSFWNLLLGLPSVMGVVIAVFGYFGGTINISLNPESSGGRK